jgi:HSP20 family molecular chaperone IbpA
MFYDLFFDKDFAKVNRAIRDSHPYQILKDEGKDVIVLNALGIAEEDIKVEVKQSTYDDRTNYLYITGETDNEITGTKYSISNRFTLNRLKVKEIKYECKDGLLYVDVFYKTEPVKEIPISKK